MNGRKQKRGECQFPRRIPYHNGSVAAVVWPDRAGAEPANVMAGPMAGRVGKMATAGRREELAETRRESRVLLYLAVGQNSLS